VAAAVEAVFPLAYRMIGSLGRPTLFLLASASGSGARSALPRSR
jgi:hypothetical protein